jgi:hypothetical protein
MTWESPDKVDEILKYLTPRDRTLARAAPDLLAVAKRVYEMLPHRSGDCYSNDYMGACVCGKALLKAVIAKAEDY